ncbi:hypothetical protein KAT82_04190, partial [bacterium]|nr:hypothetical protein [bacterium]
MRRRSQRGAGPLLRRWLGHGSVILLAIVMAATAAGAAEGPSTDKWRRGAVPRPERRQASSHSSTRTETLWIFDADFEDLIGDNAGWISEDRSGTLAVPNHWHKDTIRINGFEWLGDSTWWCGTYNPCWRQPRGYGNDWYQILERSFPEVEALTDPGDPLELRFDQRIAMENDYDYGYVDIRCQATSDTWYTLIAVDNPGFAGTPGISQDWDSTNPVVGGHIELDLTDYSGHAFDLRFRFESDMAYSSQDQWDNPPHHSVLDGAWQLDNIELVAWTPDPVLVFLDDCESPGNNGWVHDDIPAQGQTGVTFWRGLYGTDIWTNRPYSCEEQEGWMYAAVDPLTSRMVDNEYAWLISPPIDISDAEKLVGQWDMWVDLPRETEDIFNLSLASTDDEFCLDPPAGFCDESPGWWYGGPFWGTWTDDWDAFAGNNWLMIRWEVLNSDDTPPGVEHMGGIFLNRQRVGIPIGPPPTFWDYDIWDRFCDTFDLAEALAHETYIVISDEDGIESAFMVVSNDGGQTWGSYPLTGSDPYDTWWDVPNPSAHIAEATEILYYFEATDCAGVTSTLPKDAPTDCYEFSVLPIVGSVSEPAVLLVDKHGRTVPGEDGGFRKTSEDYFREALDILGYEYDVFDVCVPSGVIRGDGPDTSGMKYYDTQIWASSSFSAYSLTGGDQWSLTEWLVESVTLGAERNLLLTGNDFGSWLEEGQAETLNFYTYWLASDWVQDLPLSSYNPDTTAWVHDAAGGFDFMTHDDGECRLWDGCPLIAYYDVVQPISVDGAELVAEYVLPDMSIWPAGVAYTHAVWGYQTVNLGFGMEFMMDELVGSGTFGSGASDRVNLMANIMEYFEKAPTSTPTGAEEGEVFADHLGHARPNPFNPVTTID